MNFRIKKRIKEKLIHSPFGEKIRLNHVIAGIRIINKIYSSGVSIKRIINYQKIVMSASLGLSKSHGRPIHLTIEPTNICDQKCPICETGNGTLQRKKRMLKFSEFKYIIDQFDDNLEQVFLYFMGEPFLNKDAYRMIRYAYGKGLWVSVCTNGNPVHPKNLVESGVAEINFQIAGMTQKTHEIYRIGGDLEKSLIALKETIRIRDSSKNRNKSMKIKAGFILQKHNEHELEDFIRYCKEIGIGHYDIIGTCLREPDEWDLYMPSNKEYWLYDDKSIKKGKLVPKIRPDNHCGWIYSTMTIQVNGDVVPCCADPRGKYVMGNVFVNNVYDIWNNKKYKKLRKTVSTQSNDFRLCSLCSSYNEPPLGMNRDIEMS